MQTGALLEFWASQVIANSNSWCCSSAAYNIIIIFQHILNKIWKTYKQYKL